MAQLESLVVQIWRNPKIESQNNRWRKYSPQRYLPFTKNGKLYEGFGEILKVNDATATFANPSKIDYSESFIFSKVICK